MDSRQQAFCFSGSSLKALLEKGSCDILTPKPLRTIPRRQFAAGTSRPPARRTTKAGGPRSSRIPNRPHAPLRRAAPRKPPAGGFNGGDHGPTRGGTAGTGRGGAAVGRGHFESMKKRGRGREVPATTYWGRFAAPRGGWRAGGWLPRERPRV